LVLVIGWWCFAAGWLITAWRESNFSSYHCVYD